MVYESSYESGRKPFTPDTTRGHWAQPNDFIFLGLGLALKLDFFMAPMENFAAMGIFAFVPYLICLGLYTVPIMMIQSFMGQFSSSGFISAFRVSPIFKGMGYVSLALNFLLLCYNSVFATMPMLFFFDSLKPTLPWSCEAFNAPGKHWKLGKLAQISICNFTDIERVEEQESMLDDLDTYSSILFQMPSTIYFESHFFETYDDVDYFKMGFSWQLFGCTMLLWSIIAGIFYKYYNTAELGKILRYAIWTTLALLLICIIRFMFLPGAVDSLSHYVLPKHHNRAIEGITNVFLYTIQALGPGWGTIITLSSFNKFNQNIMRDSWIICLGQMLIFMAFNFATMLINWHFTRVSNDDFWDTIYTHWELYISTASAIASMRFANFWSLLFYGMLTLAALTVMITQIYCLLVSIFDEFEFLRQFKMRVTFGLIGILSLASIFLCTNQGIRFFGPISIDSVFTQTALNLLLLLAILWIYGRERFQRDIEFMLGQTFPTWKVNMLRFVAPLCLMIILFFTFMESLYEHWSVSIYLLLVELIFIFLPWISIPIYGFYMTFRTLGSWKTRIQRSCRPTDWYPVDKDDRQRYEDAMGNENITHQLNDLAEEEEP